MVGLTDDGIAKLEPISNQIEELSLREVWSDYMGPNGLTRIGGWTRLRTLSYNCNGTGTLDLSSLATCKRLTHFTLYHGDLMQTEHFRQLATAKSLEILSLCGCSFDGDDLIFLQNHPNLTTFSLTNCSPEPYIDLWKIDKESDAKIPLIGWSPSNLHKQTTDKLVFEKLITEQGN